MLPEEVLRLLHSSGVISDKDTLRGLSKTYGLINGPEKYNDKPSHEKKSIQLKHLNLFRKAIGDTKRTDRSLAAELNTLLTYYNDYWNHDGTFHKENDDEIIG